MTLYNPNTLLLFAHDSNQDQLGGLCGQYNGDGTDVLTLPDGTTTTDEAAFAAAWQTACNRNAIVAAAARSAQCSSGNEQAAHDHCLAATSEQLLSMYDAGELEELFANLNVTEILLQSGLDVSQLLDETFYDILGSLGMSQQEVDQVLSTVGSYTGDDLTGLGASTLGAYISDGGVSEDEAGMYILGFIAVNATTNLGYDLQTVSDLLDYSDNDQSLVDVMGMQFLSLMYTFNVAVDGVFNENMCGNDQECLFGALVE